MDDLLAQKILELIYRDPAMHRSHKEHLTDWILDTQPRTLPLDASALLRYLASHQPEILNRLKINIRIKDELAKALDTLGRN